MTPKNRRHLLCHSFKNCWFTDVSYFKNDWLPHVFEMCIFIGDVLFVFLLLLLNYLICCMHTLFSFICEVIFNLLYQTLQPNSGDKSPKNGSNGSLVKLARRFSQRGERKDPRTLPLNITDDQPHRQRSVSVDR